MDLHARCPVFALGVSGCGAGRPRPAGAVRTGKSGPTIAAEFPENKNKRYSFCKTRPARHILSDGDGVNFHTE